MLRNFLIAVLHALTSVLIILLFSLAILPSATGLTLGVPIWLMQFVAAFAFGHWAYQKTIPDAKRVFSFLGIWLPINLAVVVAYLYLAGIWPSANLVIPYDVIAQIALQIIAILIAAYKIRRVQLKNRFLE